MFHYQQQRLQSEIKWLLLRQKQHEATSRWLGEARRMPIEQADDGCGAWTFAPIRCMFLAEISDACRSALPDAW